MNNSLNNPEMQIGIFAAGVIGGYGVYLLLRRLSSGSRSPDPWGESVAAEVASGEATPLCHRCLLAHNSSADFCPACGATVGQYTNWLPYPYLFSVGHTLRIGTSGAFRRSPLTVFGFLLFSLAEYTLFAPVYWVVMLRQLGNHPEPDKARKPSPPTSGETNV